MNYLQIKSLSRRMIDICFDKQCTFIVGDVCSRRDWCFQRDEKHCELFVTQSIYLVLARTELYISESFAQRGRGSWGEFHPFFRARTLKNPSAPTEGLVICETDPSRRSLPFEKPFLFIGRASCLAASPPRYSYANTGLSVGLVTPSTVFKLLRDFANDAVKFDGPVAIWAPLARPSVRQQPYKNSIHAVLKIITHCWLVRGSITHRGRECIVCPRRQPAVFLLVVVVCGLEDRRWFRRGSINGKSHSLTFLSSC